jgi:hypothetical protein
MTSSSDFLGHKELENVPHRPKSAVNRLATRCSKAWTMLLALIAAIAILGSCNRGGATKAKAKEVVDHSGKASNEISTAPPAPRPRDNPERQKAAIPVNSDPFCARLREGISFFECNDPPRTKEYPDCRAFVFQTNSMGCPPNELELSITGYPALVERLRVRASSESSSARLFKLILSRVDPPPYGTTPETALAILEVDANGKATMVVGEGLRGYTRKKSVHEQLSDARPLPSAKHHPGDPVPLGNGQSVKGLE